MQTQNRLLDDLARVATGALGVATGMRQEVEGRLRAQFERILAEMDLVTREEFDVVKAMAAKARQRQEELEERLAALEAGRSGGGARKASPKRKKAPAAKSAAKTSSGKSGAS
ncbi:MAG: accessory factor UbiK family protein [Rhodovibrionaceae bacterium]